MGPALRHIQQIPPLIHPESLREAYYTGLSQRAGLRVKEGFKNIKRRQVRALLRLLLIMTRGEVGIALQEGYS